MRTLFMTAICAVAATTSAHAGQLWLTMDQVRPYKVERGVAKIIIGNPSIADVRVEDENNLLFFGKAPGLTNIFMYDANGEVIDNMYVRVRTPSTDMLTVHRGPLRTTYNCTTNCEATITVGDDPAIFSGVTAQVQNKFQQAAASAAGGSNQ